MSRKYRTEWENDPLFSPWLCNDPENDLRAYCKLCNTSLSPKKDLIRRHGQCELHKRMEVLEPTGNNNAENIVEAPKNVENIFEAPKNVENIVEAHTNDENIVETRHATKRVHETDENAEHCDGITEHFTKQLRSDEKYIHKYRKEWEKDFIWLHQVSDNSALCRCTACDEFLTANITVLRAHTESKKHRLNSVLDDIFDDFNFQEAITEIKMSAMIVDRSLAFLLMDHLMPFLRQTAYDSVILDNALLNRQKISLIIRNVIAPSQTERLTDILKNRKFSILIDESTDITVHQSVCILVRYWDDERGVHDSLWDLVPIYDSDENCKADSEAIFNKVITTFEKADVPISNIFAFCSDTCNLMMGAHNSVSEKLTKNISGIKIIKCACHIQHLCARDALKVLPIIFEQVPNLFYNYLSCSSKRYHKWKVIQLKSKVKTPLKILRPVATRWLSYFLCMERIFRRWTVATLFFQAECLENNSNDSTLTEYILLQYFQNPLNKIYHAFLASIYGQLYTANVSLQSEAPLVTDEDDIIRALYVSLLKMYMDNEYINNVSINEIDPNDTSKWKPINEIFLQPFVEEELRNVDPCQKMTFLHNCKRFLLELCNKIKKRYNFEDNLLLHIKALHPRNALDPGFHERYGNLNEIIFHVPVLTNSHDPQVIININVEWEQLLEYDFPDKVANEENISTFWSKINKCVDLDGTLVFKNIAQFARNVLCLPNSNAASERIWSEYNRDMTRFRASLAFATIRAILLSRQYIKDVGGLLHFEPNHQMFVRMIRNLHDGIRNDKTILDFSNYKGFPCSKDYLDRCKKEDKINIRSKKKTSLKDAIARINNVADSLDDTESMQEQQVSETKSHYYNHQEDDLEDNKNLHSNCLKQDFQYYFGKLTYIDNEGKSAEREYTVAKFTRNLEEFTIFQRIELFSTEFQCLEPGRWIDGEIINACATIFEQNWQNAIFISTRESFTLFRDHWISMPGDDWLLLKMKFPTSGKIFIPYLYAAHWRLFMIDVDEKVMTIIDPLPVQSETLEPEGRRIKKNIDRYVTLCITKGIRNILTENDWNFVWFQSDRPFQHDGINCGLYVIYYMDTIGKNNRFNYHFNPDSYRLELAKILIINSEEMNSVCQFCFSNRNADKVFCQTCKRFSHYDCLEEFLFVDLCKLCQIYLKR